jgi:hypothetical protein
LTVGYGGLMEKYLYRHIIVSGSYCYEDECFMNLLIEGWGVDSISSAGGDGGAYWMIILSKRFKSHEIEMGIKEIRGSFREGKREREEGRKRIEKRMKGR